MSDSESPDTPSSRIRVGMNVTAYVLIGLLTVSSAAVVIAAEESSPAESSQPKTSSEDAPTGSSEKSVEALEVESSEEPLDTFVPSEQVSPDSSISFPIDI